VARQEQAIAVVAWTDTTLPTPERRWTLIRDVAAGHHADGNGFCWAAGVGYRVGEGAEIRVQGNHTANPARRQVGTVAGLPLFALLDEHKAFGMDFGHRQFFGTAMALRRRRRWLRASPVAPRAAVTR